MKKKIIKTYRKYHPLIIFVLFLVITIVFYLLYK
jgi:hypothetical protein